MKRPKPKPKAKPKAKPKLKPKATRKPKQHRSSVPELVLTRAQNQGPRGTVVVQGATENLASIVETLVAIEKSASPAELRNVSGQSANAVEARAEAEDLTTIVAAQVAIEKSASPAEAREAAEIAASTVTVPAEIEDLTSIVEIQLEIENAARPAEVREATEDSASAVESPAETEDLASIIELEVEIENASSPAQVRNETGNTIGSRKAYDGTEIPTIPVAIPVVKEPPAARSAAPAGVDRRAHPRYPFTAPIEVVAAESNARIKTQVRDLSQQGCYVDTSSPLALGTATDVRITKGATVFAASARVVYNQTGKGMGLQFIAVGPEQFRILETWIAESRESSWRASNRRRSQRAVMKIPVRVAGQGADGAHFEEKTYTLSISAHGALIAVAAPVHRGQRFILSNLQTRAALECVVVHLERIAGEPTKVGVEFTLPNPTFWRMAFPPKDWTPRHPDAKSW